MIIVGKRLAAKLACKAVIALSQWLYFPNKFNFK